MSSPNTWPALISRQENRWRNIYLTNDSSEIFDFARWTSVSVERRRRHRTSAPVKDGVELRMSEKTATEKVRIYSELCKGVEGCGICLSICRQELFKASSELNRKGYRPPEIAESELCTSCENCMIFCPDLAIAVAKKTEQDR